MIRQVAVFGVTVLGTAIYIIVSAEGAVQGAATIYKRHISTFRFIPSIPVFLLLPLLYRCGIFLRATRRRSNVDQPEVYDHGSSALDSLLHFFLYNGVPTELRSPNAPEVFADLSSIERAANLDPFP